MSDTFQRVLIVNRGEPAMRVIHPIEVRLNAEDAESGFAPAPGTVELFRLPQL